MKKVDVYRKYIFDEMSKNKEYNTADLDNLVKSLNNDQSKQFCKYYSNYRKNIVYDFISKGPEDWKEKIVNISSIDVGYIRPEINLFLEENNWLLEKIVKDKRIYNHGEFKNQGDIHNNCLSFIAKKNHHRYKIVDGIHRIIRLACDNKKEFKLIYYQIS